jgi:hypothetical protein
MKKSPRFDDVRDGWEFRPVAELHSTADKEIYEFDVDDARGRIPVLAGASFNLWQPDFARPYAYVPVDVLRPYLAKKLEVAVRNSRSAFFRVVFQGGALPMDVPRIAFRDLARSTDTRTTLACLMPAGSSFAEMAPTLVRLKGDAGTEAYLLGVMSSIPFDWASRRWVELHLKYYILNALPVPRYQPDSSLCERVAEVSGRLAAVDDRYTDWASEVGVPVGSVKTQAEKDDLIAELDALVSILYGLTEDQVRHIFVTFHRGWDVTKPDYVARVNAVVNHYRMWQGTA